MTRSLPATGTIEDLSVNRIFRLILDEGREGCLVLSRGRIRRRLFFSEGMITCAMTNERSDRLGEILVTQGKITREELQAAVKKSRESDTRVGRVLLVEGRITSHDLYLGITAQVVTILDRVRSWRKGYFAFHDGEKPEAGTVLLRIPLTLYLGTSSGKRRRRERVPKEPPHVEEPVAEAGPAGEEVRAFQEEPGEVVVLDLDDEGPGMGDAALAVETEAFNDSGEGAKNDAPEEGEIDAAGGLPGLISMAETMEQETAAREAGPEHDEKVSEICFMVQELKRRIGDDDRFFLGVAPESGEREVARAYEHLVRILDPAVRPGGLPPGVGLEADALLDKLAAARDRLAAAARRDAARRSHAAAPPPGRIVAERRPAGEEKKVPEPAGTATGVKNDHRSLLLKGKDFISRGNYWQAADVLRQAVRIHPDDPTSRSLLGLSLMQTGRRLHEAEEHVREAIHLDPWNPEYYTYLGLVYKAGRLYQKARDAFQKALEYDRRYEPARRELRSLKAEPAPRREHIWRKLFRK